jgi:hypothetical protein
MPVQPAQLRTCLAHPVSLVVLNLLALIRPTALVALKELSALMEV